MNNFVFTVYVLNIRLDIPYCVKAAGIKDSVCKERRSFDIPSYHPGQALILNIIFHGNRRRFYV